MLVVLISFIIIVLVIAGIYTAVHDSLKFGIDTYKTASLRSNFSKLGNLNGKTYGQIASQVGPATESYLIKDDSGASVYRKIWKTKRYCIWIIFGYDGKFRAIEKEINS